MRLRQAFTLIEILVVVAIIALLIGILIPVLSKARGGAKRTVCAASLHQIGIGLRSYLTGNNERFPYASFMPSIGPSPLEGKPIYVADALLPELGNQAEVFKCPNDQPNANRPAPNKHKSYYQSERSSYEFSVRLNGQRIEDFATRFEQWTHRKLDINKIWIMRDYDNFHAPAGQNGSRRYLYNDGHVTDFEM